MDGFEFLKEFKQLKGCTSHIAIFILTTSSHSKDVNLATQFGVNGFITKPFLEEFILEVI